MTETINGGLEIPGPTASSDRSAHRKRQISRASAADFLASEDLSKPVEVPGSKGGRFAHPNCHQSNPNLLVTGPVVSAVEVVIARCGGRVIQERGYGG
jgi:hypothetical protein